MKAPSIVRPVILVVAPMPAMPTSAGNRRRLLATCDFLKEVGFDIDFAYVAHEDQIYRRFNQQPPTDMEAMEAYFRRVYLVEIAEPIRLKTGGNGFGIDDWCPPEIDAFVRAYFAESPGTGAVLVNYVWLSRALEAAPAVTLKLIDTHDRFAGRKAQYQPFRAEANFFHTDAAGEARGLNRADVAIAIQPAEQAYFAGIMGRSAALLLPVFPEMRPFVPLKRVAAVGFMGHGNDANLFSIGRFAGIWGKHWKPHWPKLVIAGEICRSLPGDMGPGIRLVGYVKRVDDFFDMIDLVVAPILFGTGLKMKVVEALSYGAPVVGTQLAFEGIETDAPDHRLDDLERMVDRIIVLSDDAQALAELCAASSVVFQRYCKSASDAATALADSLRQRGMGHLERDVQFLPVKLEDKKQATPASAQRGSAEGEWLVATEFRPFKSEEPEAARSARRRWYVPGTNAMCLGETDPVDGRQVSLSPLVTAVPTTLEQQRLSVVAIEALAAAATDWRGEATLFANSTDVIRVTFAGPSFLLKPVVPLRAFALDGTGHAHEISSATVVHVACADLTVLSAVDVTARCGDASLFSLSLTGGWTNNHPKVKIVAIIVIAHALFGRIDIPAVARTEKNPGYETRSSY